VIVRFLILSVIILSPAVGCSQGYDLNAPSETQMRPLRGTMAGLKLAFSRIEVGAVSYSAASVHYGDDKDWWGGNPKVKQVPPSQDSMIRDFMITLNRSTFRPIDSVADVSSYAGNFRVYGDQNLPSESSRWLEFIFSPRLYSEGNGRLKHLYEEQVALSSGPIGPFISRGDVFGLRQISSDREGGPFLKSEAHEVYDTWYIDDKSWRTLIVCMRHSNNVSPLKLTCVHYFVVPEMKTIAYGRYMATADVADWKRIEDAFRKQALSFLVAAPAQ
jgi:hypothetical protein